jgi:RNA recognition motif-containing protein
LAFDQKELGGNSVQIRRAPTDSSLGGPKEQAALRLSGLPFKASDEDIAEFFADYNMVAGSVKYQMSEEGRKTGHAAVLFEDAADAERAFKDKQKQEIGGRWILLNDLDVDDHAEFESFNPENKNVRCGDSVTEDNVDQCVKIRGLPWAANKGTVIEFFEGFTIKKGDITIDIQGGKNSGFAVIVMPSAEEAERAVGELDKKTIGSRWIGVSPAELRRGRGG